MIVKVLDRGTENPVDILAFCCLWFEGDYA